MRCDVEFCQKSDIISPRKNKEQYLKINTRKISGELLDFKYYLNNNPRVTEFINGWICEYLATLHDVPNFINDIEISIYQVKFCTIYWTDRESFVSECSTVVKYKVLSEGLTYTTRFSFWLDGYFALDDLQVMNFRTSTHKGLESHFTQRLDLIPYMNRGEYDIAASHIISKYYPEFSVTTDNIGTVDVILLAQRMELNLVFLNVSEVNEQQRAMVKFDNEPVKAFDPETGEIIEYLPTVGDLIVDAKLLDPKRVGELNNSILHECVHWEFHWQHFAFKRILSNYYGSPKLIPLNLVNENPEYAMECQAKGIAPRILMPKNSVEKMIISTMGEYSYLGFSNVTELSLLAKAVDKVAVAYHASKQSAKIRIEELGFSNNSSVYDFVDGSYVPSHITSASGETYLHQTFTIGFSELINLASANSELSELLLTGEYVYADKFVCLNDSRYVQAGPFGHLVLTDQALNDVSKCCLSFSYEYLNFNSGLSTQYEYTLFKLSEADYGRILNGFNQNAEILDVREEAVALDNFNAYIQEIISENEGIVDYLYDVRLTFEEVVSKIVEYRGYDNQEFVAQTNLHRNFLSKLRQFKGTSYEEMTLLRLFVGLKIPTTYLEKFFAIAGKTINPTDKKMQYITQLISVFHGIEIDKFEKLVKQIPA
ncbi:hypothetical protein [Streptococcus suis]|uniref:hypothetical protein n=1 Tax=Streptococcus suis TaxID=1307 RepID=UPI001C93B670|nr:hypothetical protein [Streptococcus suis]MBY4959446.1 hypothetical protein [Streptococcus suis]